MRRKTNTKIKVIILILLIGVLGVLLADRMRTDYSQEEYSAKYIGVSEVKAELGFTVYTAEEWDNYFAVYHKEYLTWEMLSQLLDKLGVSEEISVEKKSRERAVSREEWNSIYEQILDYLDMEKNVMQRSSWKH